MSNSKRSANLVKNNVVVASAPVETVAPVVVPEAAPVVTDVPKDGPQDVPAEPVATELVVTLDRTWPDGAGAYVIEGVVGKIYVKPGFFSGPPPASLKLVGLNLIAQPAPVVKKSKAAKLEVPTFDPTTETAEAFAQRFLAYQTAVAAAKAAKEAKPEVKTEEVKTEEVAPVEEVKTEEQVA